MSSRCLHWGKFGESSTFWPLSQQRVNRMLMGVGLGPEWRGKKRKEEIVIISRIPDGHS